MDEVEKTRSQMEQENQKRQDQRRKFSTNYEAFSVDLSEESSVRRETFYVLPKINHTQSLAPPNQLILDNKENSRGFPSDISGISPSEERVAIQKSMIKSAHGDVLTSTPLQRQNLEKWFMSSDFCHLTNTFLSFLSIFFSHFSFITIPSSFTVEPQIYVHHSLAFK